MECYPNDSPVRTRRLQVHSRVPSRRERLRPVHLPDLPTAGIQAFRTDGRQSYLDSQRGLVGPDGWSVLEANDMPVNKTCHRHRNVVVFTKSSQSCSLLSRLTNFKPVSQSTYGLSSMGVLVIQLNCHDRHFKATKSQFFQVEDRHRGKRAHHMHPEQPPLLLQVLLRACMRGPCMTKSLVIPTTLGVPLSRNSPLEEA